MSEPQTIICPLNNAAFSQVRACQWRFPDGPCEVIAWKHRQQIVAVTKGHLFLDVFPVVRLAWRTRIFGAPPPSSTKPILCSRADEIIACTNVDGSGVPSFWDKVRGVHSPIEAHGSIWHMRDTPGLVNFCSSSLCLRENNDNLQSNGCRQLL
jgi:hypothetical protein